MNEQWIQWKPLNNLSRKYDVDHVVDGIEGFSISLTNINNENDKIRMFFEYSVETYRNTEEGLILKTQNYLSNKYGISFYGDWTFFKVINSSYLAWVIDESYGTINRPSLTHYCIIAGNCFLDIITDYEPKVEKLKL